MWWNTDVTSTFQCCLLYKEVVSCFSELNLVTHTGYSARAEKHIVTGELGTLNGK